MSLQVHSAQTNGEIERAVATAKKIIGTSDDPYLAMLSYRATPLEHGFSPADQLMGRKLCTTLPMVKVELKPRVPDWATPKDKDEAIKDRQSGNFNSRHEVRELPPLSEGNPVCIPYQKTEGMVNKEVTELSFQVTTLKRHLILLHDTEEAVKSHSDGGDTEGKAVTATPTHSTRVTTRSGREVKVPARYKD